MSQGWKILLTIFGIAIFLALIFNLIIAIFAADKSGYYVLGLMIFSITTVPLSILISLIFLWLFKNGKALNSTFVNFFALVPLLLLVINLVIRHQELWSVVFWWGWCAVLFLLIYRFLRPLA